MTVWHEIIPKPASVKTGSGYLRITHPLRLEGIEEFLAETGCTPDTWVGRINRAASRFLGDLKPLVALSGGDDEPGITIVSEAALPADAYRLEVAGQRIGLFCSSLEGLSQAMACMVQALLLGDSFQKPGLSILPSAVIEDSAESPWRGFMLDAARHFIPAEALEMTADYLWLLRMNRFHLHLTDDQGWRLEVDRYPGLTRTGSLRDDRTSEGGRVGGCYTAGELRLLDEGCRMLGITVVPEIDLPGHASALFSAYPEFSCLEHSWSVETRWGIFPAVVCASKSAVADLLEAVYCAAADLFKGPFLHIGGDEVPTGPWMSCPSCSRLDNPYQRLISVMASTASALGKRPLVWDEAAEMHLPEETAVINWRSPGRALKALERGHDVILAPQERCAYFDHKHTDSPLEPGRLGVCTVADVSAFAPLHYIMRDDLPGGTAGSILGGQANLWTEDVRYYREIEYMAYLRLAALAEGLWSGKPAAESGAFSRNLARLRRSLTEKGFNIYPGPLKQPAGSVTR